MFAKNALIIPLVALTCVSTASAATLPVCTGGIVPTLSRPYTVIKYVSKAFKKPIYQINGDTLGNNFSGLWVIEGDLTGYSGVVYGYQASYVYFISGQFCLSGFLWQDLTFPVQSFITFLNGAPVLSQSGWTLSTQWGYAGVDAYGFTQGGDAVDDVFQLHFDNAGNPSWSINNYTRSYGTYRAIVYK